MKVQTDHNDEHELALFRATNTLARKHIHVWYNSKPPQERTHVNNKPSLTSIFTMETFKA